MYYGKRIAWFWLVAAVLAACGGQPAKKAEQSGGKQPSEAMAKQLQAQSRYGQALQLMSRGKLKSAEMLLEQMTQDYPEMAGPYANLGILYHKTKRLEEAEKALQKALSLNPSVAKAHNQLGIIYRKTGRFDKARRSYERALQINPRYALAHLNLGILYDLYLTRLEPALRHYEQYQQLSPAKDKKVAGWIIDLKRRMKASSGNNVSKHP